MSSFLTVNEINFPEQVLKASLPVIVEFGAVWCAPCKRLEPIMEKLGEEWGGKVRLVKIDVDESVNVAMNCQVMSVPTLILFVQGQEKQRLTGLQSRGARGREVHSLFLIEAEVGLLQAGSGRAAPLLVDLLKGKLCQHLNRNLTVYGPAPFLPLCSANGCGWTTFNGTATVKRWSGWKGDPTGAFWWGALKARRRAT